MSPSRQANASVVRTASTSRGFSLLEVLIAILIFSFGMLGLAALQSFSVKTNQSANFRTQATSLAYMIIDRMRANPEAALQGQYLAPYTVLANCNAAPPASPPTAAHDIAVWRQELCRQLPDGQGDISFPGGTVVVAIKWTDSRWALNAADRNLEFDLTTTL